MGLDKSRISKNDSC